MSASSRAYEGAAAAWDDGPARLLYDRLAEHIVAPVAPELAGALVLDIGAGTGALCRALRAYGAIPVAVDSSVDMLSHVGGAALISVVGDMLALPFLDDTFDGAVSGFAVSHVDVPERALAEMGRVVRGRGRVLVAVFGAASPHASKDVVDGVAMRFGFRAPGWYTDLKSRHETLSNTPERLRACAEAGGLQDVRIDDLVIDSGLDSPAQVVRYRLGMAHLAPFIATLPRRRREQLVSEAEEEIRDRGQPVRPRVLVLSSRASA